MSNLASDLVAKVVSTDKSGNIITVKNKAEPKQQVFRTLSSGGSARLGDRIQVNIEFDADPTRTIGEIYLRYKIGCPSADATQSLTFTNGIVPFINELKVMVNDKTISLYQHSLSNLAYLSRSTNYDDYQKFANDRVPNGLRPEEDQFGNTRLYFDSGNLDYVDIQPAWRKINSIKGGDADTPLLMLPLSHLTNMFKNVACSHIQKLSIQMVLQDGSGGATDFEPSLYCGRGTNTTISPKELIEFKNMDLMVMFDKYDKPTHPERGILTIHDDYFERKEYDASANQTLTVNLNQDFSPCTNIKRMYLHFKSTTIDATNSTDSVSNMESAHTTYLSNVIESVELLRNGIRILELDNKVMVWEHQNNYFQRKFRHYKNRNLDIDHSPVYYFIDFTRGDIPHNNDKHQIIKEINGLQNFTQERGQYTLRFKFPASLDARYNKFYATIHATRLFHIGDKSNGFRVTEEV